MNGKELAEKVLGNINKVIVGKEETAKLMLTAILADGHVLLEVQIIERKVFQNSVHTGSSSF